MSNEAMRKIYVVEAIWDYDGSSNIRAFASKWAADEFCRKCQDYQATKVWYTASYEDDKFDEWSEENKKWEAGHPAGQGAGSADNFHVFEVDFDESETA